MKSSIPSQQLGSTNRATPGASAKPTTSSTTASGKSKASKRRKKSKEPQVCVPKRAALAYWLHLLPPRHPSRAAHDLGVGNVDICRLAFVGRLINFPDSLLTTRRKQKPTPRLRRGWTPLLLRRSARTAKSAEFFNTLTIEPALPLSVRALQVLA